MKDLILPQEELQPRMHFDVARAVKPAEPRVVSAFLGSCGIQRRGIPRRGKAEMTLGSAGLTARATLNRPAPH
jgi:hypothetical protein